MKKKSRLLLILLAVGFNAAFSQVKKVVAVMPFLSSTPENKGTAAALQSTAIQVFSANANITLVDRSADAFVLKELDNQIREQSISSKTVVQQGKLTGSEEIIIGTLNSVTVSQKAGKFSASLNYTLQIDDAETGKLVSTKIFNGSADNQDITHKVFGALSGNVINATNSLMMSDTKDAAIQAAVANTKKEITQWIKEAYPPNIKLLSVETRDGRGFPVTVTLAGLSNDVQSPKGITVNEVSYIESDGIRYKKVKKIADLKITSLQGDIVEAKVRDGGELLDEKIKSGAKLQFMVN